VGRSHDADVGGDALVAPHPLEHALLQHPQELDLHREGHVADLVEEQGAGLGHLEPPAAGADGPGERPLLVSEELTLQELGGDRPAVEGHEGLVAARGLVVDVARHHLLAGAGLAEDQDGRVGVRHLLDHPPHPPHRRAGAHQAAEELQGTGVAARVAVLEVHVHLLQGVLEGLQAQRQGHPREDPLGQLPTRLAPGLGRDDQHHRDEAVRGLDGAEALGELALARGRPQQGDVRAALAAQVLTALGDRADRQHLVLEEFQDVLQVATALRVRVHHQHALHDRPSAA